VRLNLPATAIFLFGPRLFPAGLPNQPAERAFESYIANLEGRLARQRANPDCYTTVLSRQGPMRTDAARQILAGDILVERVNAGSWPVDGGLLHHSRAAAFVPSASPQDMLALLRDYNHLALYYSPEVVSSHVLANDGAVATVAMRLKKQQVITVVLDGEFQVDSGLAGGTRGYSTSRSTHIWQIDRPGTASERRLAEGEDDGFLWRLNSYWSFEKWRDGLVIECEAVSLTRAVPHGLGWLIAPIIGTLPRDSLQFTLTATKRALAARAKRKEAAERKDSNGHTN
jgi:hypothetical protein